MIPTKANIAKVQGEKRKQKPRTHANISNTFIENAIQKSNYSTLKTMFYLATVLSEVDMTNMKDNKIVGIKIPKRAMLKFTELTAGTIIKSVKRMQETSITFVDPETKGVEGYSLLPRYNFVPNKDYIEFDIYVRIAKMLVEVKTNYTKMNIKNLMLVKSSHSLRFMALLNRIAEYSDNVAKRKVMSLDDLNLFFGTNYKSWTRIENKIIKPIKEELDLISKYSFIYESNFTNLGRGRPKFRDVTIDLTGNEGNLFST